MRSLLPAFSVICAALAGSCARSTEVQQSYFDSLVVAQVRYLVHTHPSLTKTARMGPDEDRATFVPDSMAWENELDVFRQLSAFQRPAHRKDYIITDGIRDEKSNLSVKTWTVKPDVSHEVPITRLRFF